jgi:S-(hydroxymethyl)glutathione dehydrogenase / alcohol dehydrogenase
MLAAVLTRHNAPLTLAEVTPAPLTIGQVLVRVLVSGICGAQLQEIRGEKGGPLPHLLGHEGCGIVEDVGPGVSRVQRGQKVVMHWRKAAGIESTFPEYTYDGKRMTSGLVTTFSEQSICSENRLTPVADDTPVEFCALMGCGLSSALGTVEQDANIKFGESVLVIGCGGLGGNLIRASAMRGATPLDVIDLSEGKREAAWAMGATTFWPVNGGDWRRLAELQGRRYDVILDTAGASFTMEQALTLLAPSGRYIMIGQPKPGESVSMTAARHMFDGEGKTIRATQGGGFRPHLDIPRYLALYNAGKLDLNSIITHRVKLAQINDGIDFVKNGEAGRVLVEMT